jgi:DNA-binding NarL/FixJ family response regulator
MSQAARRPTTALIVDDEEDMRALVRFVIQAADNGLTVVGEATDGDAALERWREHRPDVVVMDERMPRATGLETAARILAEDPKQLIVLFSAFLSEELRGRAARLGIRACLSKSDANRIPEVLWGLTAP